MLKLNKRWKSVFELDPCRWGLLGWYLYGRFYGGLPPKCLNCWKALVFFDDKQSVQTFLEELSFREPWFRYKSTGKVIVGYAASVQDVEKIKFEFGKVAEKLGIIEARINHRRAGRYWQDLFPEFFVKSKHYRPGDQELFEFRLEADKLESISQIEKLFDETMSS